MGIRTIFGTPQAAFVPVINSLTLQGVVLLFLLSGDVDVCRPNLGNWASLSMLVREVHRQGVTCRPVTDHPVMSARKNAILGRSSGKSLTIPPGAQGRSCPGLPPAVGVAVGDDDTGLVRPPVEQADGDGVLGCSCRLTGRGRAVGRSPEGDQRGVLQCPGGCPWRDLPEGQGRPVDFPQGRDFPLGGLTGQQPLRNLVLLRTRGAASAAVADFTLRSGPVTAFRLV